MSGIASNPRRLALLMLGAIVSALILALVKPTLAADFSFGGELFLRMLKLLVVPLVCTSVACGVLSMGDVSKLGKPGMVALVYYLSTTLLAAAIGLVVINTLGVNLLAKGEPAEAVANQSAESDAAESAAAMLESLTELSGLSTSEVIEVFPQLGAGEEATPGLGMIIENLLFMVIPENLLASAVEMKLLPLVVFSLVFGLVMAQLGSRAETIRQVFVELNAVLMRLVDLVMVIAPIGIFCMIAGRFGQAVQDGQLGTELRQIGGYFACVCIGLAIHGVIVLPLILWVVSKRNPLTYFLGLSRALLTAFSTASSTATLPVTLECTKDLGVSKKSSGFVVPLGSTINMDGTALYEAVAAMFIAQLAGIQLGFTEQIIVVIASSLAAVGAAGIPEAGLVTMVIVLNSVGLPVELVGVILSVDWLLDRFRTSVNVWGDGVAAAVVEVSLQKEES